MSLLSGFLKANILFEALKPVCVYSHCRGNCSASLRRLLRLSAPSWLRMPGSISVSCLISAWPVMAKVLADRDACTLGLLKWITVPSSFIIFTWEMNHSEFHLRHVKYFWCLRIYSRIVNILFQLQTGLDYIFP